MGYRNAAARLTPALTELRHAFHRHPEIGLHLPWTQQRLLVALADLPLEITLGRDCSSVVAVLRGRGPGVDVTDEPGSAPAVLIRADMDALPVTEATGEPFSSERPGAMHACGHDLHMAMAIGAAHLLAERVTDLPGDVVFMFQPGEEGFDGARVMIDEGVLDASGSRVQAAYALHVFSSQIPAGSFRVRSGPIMSASDTVHLRVRGLGGHGSAPHRALDPVTAAATMILALQTMVTRRFDAFDPVVLSVGMIRGGETDNVIPDEVEIRATVRTFSAENRVAMRELVPSVVEGIAAAHGVTVETDYALLYPVTHNDPDEADFAARTVADLFGAERLERAEHPLSASEDFSFVLADVPGVFIPVGAAVGAHETSPYNHAAGARFSDDVLPDGAALLASLAHRRLQTLSDFAPTQEAQ